MADEGRRVGISSEAAPQALRPDLVSGRRRLSYAWLGTIPFFAYAIGFLFVPAASVMVGAFQDKHDHATFSNIRLLFQHPYIDAYWGSLRTTVNINARAISATGRTIGSGAFVTVIRSKTLSDRRDFTSPPQ